MKMFKRKKIKDSANTTNIVSSRFMITSFLGLIICASCLCLTSYAWFTSTVSTENTTITLSTFSLTYSYTINDDDSLSTDYQTIENIEGISEEGLADDSVQLINDNGENLTKSETGTIASEDGNASYNIENASVTFTITTDGNGTGYCLITLDDATYYTYTISKSSQYSFTVNNANGKTITFKRIWGKDVSKDASYKQIDNNTIALTANGNDSNATGTESTANEILDTSKTYTTDEVTDGSKDTTTNTDCVAASETTTDATTDTSSGSDGSTDASTGEPSVENNNASSTEQSAEPTQSTETTSSEGSAEGGQPQELQADASTGTTEEENIDGQSDNAETPIVESETATDMQSTEVSTDSE